MKRLLITMLVLISLPSIGATGATCQHKRDINVRFVSHTNKVQAVIRNLSNECSYHVGAASYRVYSHHFATQILNHHLFIDLAPGQVKNVYLQVADCASQNDIFIGPLLENFNNGLYGDRIVSVYSDMSRPFCE